MTLQEKIQIDFKNTISNKYTNLLSYFKVIIGELQRQPKKELSDDEVVAIIKKLAKYEKQNPNIDYIYIYGNIRRLSARTNFRRRT